MSRVLKWLYGLVIENFGWKLLSLLLAAALWAFVASEPEMLTNVSVPIAYRNIPDDLEISSPPLTSITLELRGPSSELRAIGTSEFHPAVILDMSGVHSGERTFLITDSNVRLPRGVQLIRAIPPEVRFQFERLATRNVPVVVRLAGEGQDGYTVATVQTNPATLEITGPASHVDGVRAAHTDPVDVGMVVGTAHFQVNAFLNDPMVRFISTPKVSVTVTMKKAAGTGAPSGPPARSTPARRR